MKNVLSSIYKKLFTKKVLSNLITILVVAFLIFYLWENREIFNSLLNIELYKILLVILLEICLTFVYSYINYLLINKLSSSVNFFECVNLQYANNFLNKISPKGGAAYRALYLKTLHKFPYSFFISTISGLYIISFSSMSIIGLLCMLYFYLSSGIYNYIILAIYLAILIGTLSIVIISPTLPNSENRLLKIIKTVLLGWKEIKKDTWQVLLFIFLTFLSSLLISFQQLIIYHSIGSNISLIQVLFLSSLSIINTFLNITPDGIGVKEGVLIFSANIVSIPGQILVLGSLILRAIGFISSMIFGSISYFILSKKLKQNN